MYDFSSAVGLLGRARTPEDVFGDDAARGASAYRELAKVVHPDRVGADKKDEASAAFARLNALWTMRCRAATITSRTHSYRLGERLARDGIVEYREACTEGRDVVLKIARRPTDNDLLRREARALRAVRAVDGGRFQAYVPELLDTLTYRDEGTDADHAVSVLDRLRGMVSLAGVRSVFPDGLDARDVAWMWRRLLVVLGVASRAGVVHAAVVPENVLIHAEEHGLVLTNWCFAVTGPGEAVPAVVARYRDWYPPEIEQGRTPTAGADIYLATRCMLALMGDRAPDALRTFARGCLLASPAARPDDAWRLLAELDEVLGHTYGRRRFRPFALPATVPSWPRQGR